jgi:hypothetical protein
MKAILKHPNSNPQIIEIDNTLDALQGAVGGYIEHVKLTDTVGIICNEDGKFNGSLANRFLYYQGHLVDILFGNILIVDTNEDGETISLTDRKIRKYMEIFSSQHIFLDL